MSDPRPTQLAQRLSDRINEVSGVLVPSHVSNRLALLSGGQPVQYVDAPLVRDRGVVSGPVRVFTEDLMVVARLEGVATQAGRDEAWPGEVTTHVVPRHSLVAMHIEAGRGHENRNDNTLWSGRETLRWPNYGEIELRYRDLPDPVILGAPSAEIYGLGTSPLDGFLDSLVADLHR